MRLRDIMSEAVESIPPDAPVDQAREQMDTSARAAEGSRAASQWR